MRAIPENINRRQSIARAYEGNTGRRLIFEGIARNKQLLYGLLPGFTDKAKVSSFLSRYTL